MRKTAFLTVAATFALLSTLAAKTYFKGVCDKDALSYKSGEEIVFSVSLIEDGKPKGGQKVKYVRRGDDGKTDSGEFVSATDKPFVYKTSIAAPGYVHLRMEAVGDDGKPLKDADKFDGGACADFDKITPSAPEPKDFDKYWKARKRALKKIQMKAELTPLPDKSKGGIDVYEIKIDSVGEPVRGYLSVPKNAAEKSLPARAVFQGYGVSDMHYWPMGDCIAIFVSPHSMDMGKDKAYYDGLKKGRLAGFGFEKELPSPKDSYFDGMILRDLRACICRNAKFSKPCGQRHFRHQKRREPLGPRRLKFRLFARAILSPARRRQTRGRSRSGSRSRKNCRVRGIRPLSIRSMHSRI